MKILATFAFATVFAILGRAQLLNIPLEEVGDETYTGGFGSANWVDAANYGFANHDGAEAFLSNYTGPTLSNLGMMKPLGGVIGNTIYRVSFYYSRYSSVNAVPYASYNYLYIGSPNGTMFWDTIPTPSLSGEWVKWSGTFTPDAADIGQPFTFGFSLNLISGSSLAIDGPLQVQDLATSTHEAAMEPALRVIAPIGSDHITVIASLFMKQLIVLDATGRAVEVSKGRTANGWEFDTSDLPAGSYFLIAMDPDGRMAMDRFPVVR